MLQKVMQGRLHRGFGSQRGVCRQADRRRHMADQGRNLAQTGPAFLQFPFERISMVEYAAQFPGSRGQSSFAKPDHDHDRGQQQGGDQQIQGQGGSSGKEASLPVVTATGKLSGKGLKLPLASSVCNAFPFDFEQVRTYHRAPMSTTLPEKLDPWRMVQGRRVFEGTLAVAQLPRLVGLLASAEGEVACKIEFGRDEFDISYVDIHVDTSLMMVCQRSMVEFSQPVHINQRLGLISDDSEEARLPEGYDPLLIENGAICLKDVIEDELILGLPVVALSPGAPLEQVPVTAGPVPEDEQPPNPFAALGQLKNKHH